MPLAPLPPVDSRFDLVLERDIDVPPELVYAAWTQPEHVKQWFTPAPWKTVECEIDLRPGGSFRTVMRGPEGEEFDGTSCWLELVENQRIVWTTALAPGFRPARPSPEALLFTAFILLRPAGRGTNYRVILTHPDEETRARHESMGFHAGWGKALDQLVAYMKTR